LKELQNSPQLPALCRLLTAKMSGADAGMDGLDALMAELSANSADSAAAPQPAALPTVKTTAGKGRQRVSGKLSGGDKGHVVVGESWADEEISSPAEVQAFVRRLRAFQMRVRILRLPGPNASIATASTEPLLG